MRALLAILLMSLLPAWASAAGHDTALERVDVDVSDKTALQDGARTFVNYCMGCHSAKFQRYERVADDLGITHALMMKELVFTGARIGDHMDIGMQPADAKAWFGTPPPDLTLVAQVRGTDWLYAYLRSFYEDPTRPWGVNNTVFPNTGMPNVLEGLQGRQRLDCTQAGPFEEGNTPRETPAVPGLNAHTCDQLVAVPNTGSLTEAQFNEKMRNLVSFLAYSADPAALQRQRIGIYVLMYLAVLLILAYLLKREYWKDVN
jgi:ubiquinol-cytochrome c reductase cytochrome c1 subunit